MEAEDMEAEDQRFSLPSLNLNSTAISSALSTAATSTTTEGRSILGLPELTFYILIPALAGTIILLLTILIIIFCRRKQRRKNIASTIETTGVFSSQPRQPLQEDGEPVYQPTPDIEDSSGYVDMNRENPQQSHSRNSGENSGIYDSVSEPIQHTPAGGEYESSVGLDYTNMTYSPVSDHRQQLPKVHQKRQLLARGKSADGEVSGNLFRQGTKAYNLYSNALHNYEIPRKQLTTTAVIGKGHFSTVYSGVATKLPYADGKNKKVAIKTMKSSAPDSDKQEFLYEFEIMKVTNSLNHNNIIRLLASVTKSHPCMIVLEHMPNGNLQNFLRNTRSQDVYYNLHGNSSSLSERQLLQFALDIANGMEGISDLQLLHRDLAARNILLDANLTCKISDFGFAKDILNKPEYKSKSVFRRARPVRWLAPESVLLFKHSILSDVWSYGVVLWEIVTLGNLPYPEMKVRQVQQALSKGYRMPCPTHCSPDLYRVMTCCWEESSHTRPPFNQLVDKMRQLLDNATRMIDMERIEEDDYIDILPPDEQELFLDFPEDDSTC